VETGNRKALSDEIINDAQKKATRAATRAERDAKKLLSQAEKKAEAVAEGVLAAARERAERQARSILATVGQEVRREELDAKEAVLDDLFRQAITRLAKREGYDYPATMAALAAEAIRAMDSAEVVLGFAQGCAAIATDEWLADVKRRVGRGVTIRIAEQPEPIRGGLVARSADGRLVYDNSFAARLARQRPELRRQVAAMLYPTARPDAAPSPPPSGEG